MFFHAFRKVFFVNKSSAPLLYPDIVQHQLNNYHDIKMYDPFLHNTYHDLMFQYKPDHTENPLIHIFLVNDEEWDNVIQDYVNYLGLDYEAYLRICKHSDFCTNYIDNCCETISLIGQSKIIPIENFKVRNKKKVYNYQHFPAEYAINCLDQLWAQNKYEYFRTYDIYNQLKRWQTIYYKAEVQLPKILTRFAENDQAAKSIFRSKELKDDVLTFLSEHGVDTDKYRVPIQEYVNMEPDLGYDRFTFYKFNWPLARYLKQIGYKIHE